MSLSPTPAPRAPRRIVIVEDELQLAELFDLSIRDWFQTVEITKFSNGNDAWERLARDEPDLLMLDCSHPGMTGGEILKRLDERGVRFPVLLTSELFGEEVIHKTQQNLKLVYLPKPFGIVQFWKVLNELVGPSDYPERQALVSA